MIAQWERKKMRRNTKGKTREKKEKGKKGKKRTGRAEGRHCENTHPMTLHCEMQIMLTLLLLPGRPQEGAVRAHQRPARRRAHRPAR